MVGEQFVTIDLGKNEQGDDVKLVVAAEPVGGTLVADEDVVARLAMLTDPIQRVGGDVLAAMKKIRPTKATVELGFGIAVESGGLVALFGKGKGDASITVTLEWESGQDDDPAGS